MIAITWARPEPPVSAQRSNGYSYQAPPSPPLLPTIANFPPPAPSDSYGAPVTQQQQREPMPSYGPPAMQQETIIHKHVYVHVAPPEPEYEKPPR